MLHASNIHVHFQAKAMHIVIYTLNHIATRTIAGRTPFELWYKEKPSVSHKRIFGSIAYVYVPKELQRKLIAKSRKGVFMGSLATSKAYCIWNNELQRIDRSKDVLFDENPTNGEQCDSHMH